MQTHANEDTETSNSTPGGTCFIPLLLSLLTPSFLIPLALSLFPYSLLFLYFPTYLSTPPSAHFLSLLSLSFCPSFQSRWFYSVCWCIFTLLSVLTMKLWRGVCIESSKFHSTRGFLSAIFSKTLPQSRGLSCDSCP